MNAPEIRSDSHFQYFPGNYRWSAEMLVVLSTAPFGGAEVSEVMCIGARLRDKVGDDEAEDAQVFTADAEKLFNAIASKDKTMRVFTVGEGGAQHCQRDYLTLACDTVADRLEDRLKK